MSIVTDLLKDKEGWSTTKIAATVAHASMAIAFIHITWTVGFLWDLWLIYGSIAIFHRVIVSSTQQFAEFKNRQLDNDQAAVLK